MFILPNGSTCLLLFLLVDSCFLFLFVDIFVYNTVSKNIYFFLLYKLIHF